MSRPEFVICECGWTLKNDGEFDLSGEPCGYKGCTELLQPLPEWLLDLTRMSWAKAFADNPLSSDSDRLRAIDGAT